MKKKIFTLFIILIMLLLSACGNSGNNNSGNNNGNNTSYNIDFYVDDKLFISVTYSPGDTVEIPKVPEKEGYNGYWEKFDTSKGGNLKVNAIYDPIQGNVNKHLILLHYPNGQTQEIIWNDLFSSFNPYDYAYDLDGYEFKEFSVEGSENDYEISIYYEYELFQFELRLYIEGEYYKSIYYTADNFDSIVLPDVPEREGMVFIWDKEEFYFGICDLNGNYHDQREYMVTFICRDKTFYAPINSDGTVTPPSDEELQIPGYIFDGWDHDLNNINQPITITGQYSLARYTIKFMADGNLVKEITYTINSSIDNLRIPDVPFKEGFECSWSDFDLSQLKDIVVEAIYVQHSIYANIFFTDINGIEQVVTLEVKPGSSVSLPEEEAKQNPKGEFIGWSHNGTNLTESTTIFALYKYKLDFTVKGEIVKTYEYQNNQDLPEITAPEEVIIPDYIGVWPSDIPLFETTSIEAEFLRHDECPEGVVIEQHHYLGYYYIGHYTGTETHVKIPGYYYGNEITVIQNNAFNDTCIESVEIPETITEIGRSAFANTKLTEIFIPGNVKTLGNGLFSNSKLKKIVISDEVESIGSNLFGGTNEIESITIPFFGEMLDDATNKNIRYLGTSFPHLKEIIITKDTSIPEDYLYLSYINEEDQSSELSQIKNSFENIEFWSLEAINRKQFEKINADRFELKNLKSIDRQAFYEATIGFLSLPNTIETITAGALGNCLIKGFEATGVGNLRLDNDLIINNDTILAAISDEAKTEIIIPDYVMTIDDGAFENNSYITSVDFNNVKDIRQDAFYNCISLTSLINSGNIETIGYYAFGNCVGLSDLYFENIKEISMFAFIDCIGIKKLIINNPTTDISLGGIISRDYNVDYIETNGFLNGVGYYADKVVINDCTIIPDNAFDNSNIVNIEIKGNLESIGYRAFYECDKLENIILPETYTSVGDEAFYNCKKLSTINLSETCTSIGSEVFYGCESLDTLAIPYNANSQLVKLLVGTSVKNLTLHNVTSIESNFYNNTDYYYSILDTVEEITIKGPIENISSRFNNFKKLRKVTLNEGLISVNSIFSQCEQLEEVVLPSTLKTIGTTTFHDCEKLIEITIPKSVELIDVYAFYDCDNLEKVNITSDVLEKIENSAFSDCDKLSEINFPNSLKEIGGNAFYNCDLKTIELNNGLTTIRDSAFAANENLSNFEIPETISIMEDYAFAHCYSITEVKIPDSITTISTALFSSCKNLNKVIFPSNLSSIGSAAFYDTAIETLDLSERVSSIGRNAFSSCDQLYQVILRAPSMNIEENAFYECFRLVEVYTADTNIHSTHRSDIRKYALHHTTDLAAESKISIDDNGFGFISVDDKNYLFNYLGNELNIKLPDTDFNYEINKYAFYYSEIESVEFNTDITRIGSHAFFRANNIKEVDIKDSVTYIESKAFDEMESLRRVKLPTAMKVSPSTFNMCYNLEQLISSISVNNLISANSFNQCYRLVEVYDLSGEEIDYDALNSTSQTRRILSIHTSLDSESRLYEDENGFCFVKNANNYLYNYYGDNESVVLPTNFSYDIASYAFCYIDHIKDVTINDNVSIINDHAFMHTEGIIEISIPNTISYIGEDAFYISNIQKINITDLEAWFDIYFETRYSNPSIAGSHEYYTWLYMNNEKIETITVPETVTEIKQYALTDIVFGDLYLHKGITKIGREAFGITHEKLGFVYIEDLISWMNIDMAHRTSTPFFVYHGHVFFNNQRFEDLVIPEEVTEIKNYAFAGLEGYSLLVHDNVTRIGEDAFYNFKFYYATLPFIGETLDSETNNTMAYINSGTISRLRELTLTLETKLDTNAFSGCYNLSSLTLPSSLKYCAEDAVINLQYFKQVNIHNINDWYDITFVNEYSNPLYLAKNLYILDDEITEEDRVKDIVIPNDITSLNDYVFAGISLNSISFHSDISAVGAGTFKSASISSKVYTNDLISWANTTFTDEYSNPTRYTKSLYLLDNNNELLVESIDFNVDDVPTLKDYTFLYLKDLDKATLTGDIVLGESALSYQKITDLNISNIINTYSNRFNNVVNLFLQDDVEVLNEYVFNDYTKLKSIKIPATLNTVGEHAFNNCNALEEILISSVTSYALIDFDGSYSNPLNICGVLKDASTLEVITHLDFTGISEIKPGVFDGGICIESVFIPGTISSIGADAFNSCENINKVTTESLDSWLDIDFASEESNPTIYSNNLYIGEELLTNMTISREVVQSYTFIGINSFNTVTLDENVHHIHSSAFKKTCIETLNLPTTDLKFNVDAFSLSEIGLVNVSDLNTWLAYTIESATASPVIYAANSNFGTDETKSIVLDSSMIINNDYAFCNIGVEEVDFGTYTDPNLSTLFSRTGTLKKVTVNEAAHNIGEEPFGAINYSIKELVFADNTSFNLYNNFTNSLVNLETLTILGHLIINYPDAFKNCTRLKTVNVKNISHYSYVGSIGMNEYSSPTIHGARIYQDGVEVKDVVIDGVNIIGGYMYAKSPSIETVKVINTDRIAVDVCAFWDCPNLRSVDMSEVTSVDGESFIHTNAFTNCVSLEEVKLPGNLKRIDDYAFASCIILKTISLPNSLERFHYKAFERCFALVDVVINTSNWYIKYYDDSIMDIVLEDANFSSSTNNANILKEPPTININGDSIIYTRDPDSII